MTPTTPDFSTDSMGECTVVSPLRTAHFMDTSKRLLFRADIDELRAQVQAGVDPAAFEPASFDVGAGDVVRQGPRTRHQ